MQKKAGFATRCFDGHALQTADLQNNPEQHLHRRHLHRHPVSKAGRRQCRVYGALRSLGSTKFLNSLLASH